MALAETYEDLDEKEKALEMVNEGIYYLLSLSWINNTLYYYIILECFLVLEARKKKRAQVASSQVTQSTSTSSQINDSSTQTLLTGPLQTESSLIQTVSEESKANAFARAEEERKQKIAEKEKETKIQFHRLDLLYDRSILGNLESAKEFLETARNVVIDWKNNRAFYPQRDRVIIL